MIPKFRVYIKNLKMMLPVNNIDFVNKTVAVQICKDDFMHNDPHEYDFNDENIVIMQSTGLKDKNKVEIFEGDVFITNNGNKYKVIWDESRFIGTDYHQETVCYVDYCNNYEESMIEVIGNIHEEPGIMRWRD